jgi:hypothetical protein
MNIGGEVLLKCRTEYRTNSAGVLFLSTIRISYVTQKLFDGFEILTAVSVKSAIFWDLRCVARYFTDVSEERATSILRVE